MAIIDKIQLSGTVYTIGNETTTTVNSASTDNEITTGETADTVSINLPISAGTGTDSVLLSNGSSATGNQSCAGGQWCSANGRAAFAFGNQAHADYNTSAAFGVSCNANSKYSFVCCERNTANGNGSFACGQNNITYGDGSFACGFNSLFNTGSTDAYNTLFSVGNGTGTNTSTRHNAFEIRRNGDIYCSDGTNDVKLQDTITATASNTTALGGLKLVKLTQSEYSAMEQAGTLDNSTLYVIVN